MLNIVVSPLTRAAGATPGPGGVAQAQSIVPTDPKAIIVLCAIQATLKAGAAAEAVDLLIRDGPTGTGTILKRFPMSAPVNGIDRVWLSVASIASSPGNQITVEFNTAPTGTGLENLTFDYYASNQMADARQYGANG